jgi:maltoporin
MMSLRRHRVIDSGVSRMNLRPALRRALRPPQWRARQACAWLLAALAVPATALAADTDVAGYLRAGSGAAGSSGHQACFKLAGAEAKYRLGNECEVYGELMLGETLHRNGNGAQIRAYAMASLASRGAGIETLADASPRYGLPQAYIAAEKLAALGGASAWLGRRYYKREDVHINDFFYWDPSGIGAGVEDYPLGALKLSYALMREDGTAQARMASRHDLQLRGMAVNPGGELQAGLSLIDRPGGNPALHAGWALTGQHVQQDWFGGWNKFALQYGVGPGTALGQTGQLTSGSDTRRARVVEQFYFQPGSAFGGLLSAVYQRDTAPAGAQRWASLGGRLTYSVSDRIKLLAELGHDRVRPAAGPARHLTKLTVAPAWTLAPGFWSRPEVRLFYTYARWDEAARLAAGAGDALAVAGLFGGATHGASAGAQVEYWW